MANARHVFTSEEAKRAGRKGGKKTARDHAHMIEIGRKGGRKRASNAREASKRKAAKK